MLILRGSPLMAVVNVGYTGITADKVLYCGYIGILLVEALLAAIQKYPLIEGLYTIQPLQCIQYSVQCQYSIYSV